MITPMSFEITSHDAFVYNFRAWRARFPAGSKQVAGLLGISLLRVHLYETGCFKFKPDRENAVFRRMRQSVALTENVHAAQPLARTR